ncbi:Solute carrier family 35 member B1 [Histomonas meleagridis]|uniref:Solute carrier family 35 member B1 n=1 Tax=Histomonas meleagridis TaxID=135588 RepID=UPI003559E229|nr:Solute carrier family 35 member B1 [Histomonas meleagridis]KAH0798442.1 Solute carrier family 35 member B1 [Histomonas meleagridis]
MPKKSKTSNNETFNYPNALLFTLNACNCIAAFIALLVTKSPIPKKPLPYLAITIPQQIGMMATSFAVKYIDYPTLSLMKSAKPVSVMLCQLLIFRKKIELKRVLVVIILCTGLAIFGINGNFGKSSELGIILACVGLFCDAIYVPLVDKIKVGNSPFVTMLYSYMWSLLIILPLRFNELKSAVIFLAEHKALIKNVLAYGISGSLAHIALFTAIGLTDGLIISIATTTRKFFTILLSAVIYHHELNRMQWLGVGIVFVALGIEIVFKQKKKPQQERPKSV